MPGWKPQKWQDFNKGQGEKSAYTRLIEKEKGELWRSAFGTRVFWDGRKWRWGWDAKKRLISHGCLIGKMIVMSDDVIGDDLWSNVGQMNCGFCWIVPLDAIWSQSQPAAGIGKRQQAAQSIADVRWRKTCGYLWRWNIEEIISKSWKNHRNSKDLGRFNLLPSWRCLSQKSQHRTSLVAGPVSWG